MVATTRFVMYAVALVALMPLACQPGVGPESAEAGPAANLAADAVVEGALAPAWPRFSAHVVARGEGDGGAGIELQLLSGGWILDVDGHFVGSDFTAPDERVVYQLHLPDESDTSDQTVAAAVRRIRRGSDPGKETVVYVNRRLLRR